MSSQPQSSAARIDDIGAQSAKASPAEDNRVPNGIEKTVGAIKEPTSPTTQTLGRYVILRELGHGGMGTVYAAYDPELDRKVALKVIRVGKQRPNQTHHDAEVQQLRSRFIREAQGLAKLKHPNIVPVYDVGTLNDGEIFMAMELVTGRPLSHKIQEQRRPWQEVAKIFLHVADALAHSHQAGLIHRDLKPDNLMLAEDGTVWVLDFGLVGQELTPEQ